MSYAAEVLADSPVLYAKLGEPSGSSATDSSANANTGTIVNAPTLGVAGPLATDPGTAMTFAAGSSQRITFPHITALNVGDTMSMEAWWKSTAGAGSWTIISLGHTGSLGNGVMRFNGGGLEILKSNVSSLGVTVANYNDGLWHYLLYTKATTTSHFYVDAVDVTPSITNATFTNSTELINIGADPSNGTPGSFLTGTVAHVAIYATALSAARAKVHYREGIASFAKPVGMRQAVQRAATRCWTERRSGISVPRLWTPEPVAA